MFKQSIFLLFILVLTLQSCKSPLLFEVGSQDVLKNERNQFTSQDFPLSASYDWWSEGGMPMIFLTNHGELPIKIHWNKSYFVIDEDTLMCYLSPSRLKNFNGLLLPPIIEKDQVLWPKEETSFEGYPFVLHMNYKTTSKDEEIPLVMTPVVQKIVINYEIEDKKNSIENTFYISKIYKTKRHHLKALTHKSDDNYDKFFKTKKVKVFTRENLELLLVSVFNHIVEP